MALGLWSESSPVVVSQASEEDHSDGFGSGAVMVVGLGVDSRQRGTEADPHAATNLRPSGSSFLG